MDPMIYNCIYGNVKETESFLKSGLYSANHVLKKKNPDYVEASVLQLACENRNFKTVELLISYGANIDYINERGNTALHCANTIEIYDFLVSKGANEKIKNIWGDTPLITKNFLNSKGCK